MTTLTLENNQLVFNFRYDAGLLAALKASIPATDRKFDPTRKAWMVAPQHGPLLAKLTAQYLGEAVLVPPLPTPKTAVELRILEVRYLGAAKARDGYEDQVAFGYSSGDWNAIFPETVLLEWFTGMKTQASEPLTLYGVLGVSRQASEDEIKSAFRRMARQWHPDVCKEPGAQEQFIRIKEAYDLLSSPRRARYDAGLALEASLTKISRKDANKWAQGTQYRPPLRCGYILAEGTERVGRFLVQRILQWDDITNPQGKTLVTSWPAGAKMFVEVWS